MRRPVDVARLVPLEDHTEAMGAEYSRGIAHALLYVGCIALAYAWMYWRRPVGVRVGYVVGGGGGGDELPEDVPTMRERAAGATSETLPN